MGSAMRSTRGPAPSFGASSAAWGRPESGSLGIGQWTIRWRSRPRGFTDRSGGASLGELDKQGGDYETRTYLTDGRPLGRHDPTVGLRHERGHDRRPTAVGRYADGELQGR